MRFVFLIAIMFLGITTAQGQTVVQPNGQVNSGATAGTNGSEANSSASVVGLGGSPGGPSSSLSSLSSPSPASRTGSGAGSSTASGSAGGAAGATGSASGASQAPLLLPGEIPDTSTQGAITTATAPGPSSPVCPPPVPSTDGGSAHLSEMAGISLGGC